MSITYRQIQYINSLHNTLQKYDYLPLDYKTSYNNMSSTQAGMYIRRLERYVEDVIEELADKTDVYGLGQE